MLVRSAHRCVALVGMVALGLGLSIAACGGDDGATSRPTTTVRAEDPTTAASTTEATSTAEATSTTGSTATTVATTSTGTTTTIAGPVEPQHVNVYWGWNVPNPPAGSPERIGAGAREVAGGDPVRGALQAMFGGVDSVEQAIGMTTSIPAGTRVLGVGVDGATATVDLSAAFAAPSGTLDETMRLAQVVFAVTQFDGIDRVRFQLDGIPQDPILSHGFPVGDGLTRNDFETVRPTILVEQPYPGADVANPLVIRGESNTFEATVRYAITSGGGDGLVVTDGFTTATGGNGTWGSFEVVVDLSDFPSGYQPGPGSIIMWEDSPRDGSQLGVVEVPVVLPEL